MADEKTKKRSTRKKTGKKRKPKAAEVAPTEPPPGEPEGTPTASMRKPAEDSKGVDDPETPEGEAERAPGEGVDVTAADGEESQTGTDPVGPPAAADPSAEPSADDPPPEPELEFAPEEAARLERHAASRRRRLDRRDPEIPDRCPITGREIDAGPRAPMWSRPTQREGQWLSALGGALVDAGVTPDELRHALEFLEGDEG